MNFKVGKRDLVFIISLLLMNSFSFLHIQQITSMQIASLFMFACSIIFISDAIYTKSRYRKIIYALFFYMLFEAVRTKIMYGDMISWQNIVYRTIEFLALPYLFVLLSRKETGYCRFVKILKTIGTIVLAICLLAGVLHTIFGVNLFEGIVIRSGRARIYYGIEFLFIVWLIYLSDICEAINSKKRVTKKSVLWLLACSVYLILFNQTRVLVIYQALFIVFAVLFVTRSFNKKALGLVLIMIAVIAILSLPSTSGYVDKILGAFSEKDGSTYSRMAEFSYYPEKIAEHPLAGYGAILGPNFDSLIKGQWGVFSPDDLGIIGFVFLYGIFAAVMYIMIVLKSLKTSFKDRFNNPLAFFLELMLIFTSATIFMLDVQRIPLLVLILFLIEGSEYRYRGKNYEKIKIRGIKK